MKRFLLFPLCLGVLCLSYNSAFADKFISSNTTINTNIRYYEDTEIGSNFSFYGEEIRISGDLKISSNAQINGDVYVEGNLSIWSNASINGNIEATGNIIFMSGASTYGNVKWRSMSYWSNAQIQEKITAATSLTLGSNATIYKWVNIRWDVSAGSNLTLQWVSKIVGDFSFGSNTKIYSTLYVYWEINKERGGSNADISGDKTKITQGLSIGSNGDINTRLYLFQSKKITGSNYSERLTNYSGLFGKIDPLLQYELTEEQIQSIKNETDAYLTEIQRNPKKKIELYKDLFQYLSQYIEQEAFDTQVFSQIQQGYLWAQKPIQPIETTNTHSIYTPYLPERLEKRLDEVFQNIPVSEHTMVVQKINIKINQLLSELKGSSQSTETINILLWIQQYLETKILEPTNEDILNRLWL